MRILQADVAAETIGGDVRLRIKTVVGESFGIQLTPGRAGALRDALDSALHALAASAAAALQAAGENDPARADAPTEVAEPAAGESNSEPADAPTKVAEPEAKEDFGNT